MGETFGEWGGRRRFTGGPLPEETPFPPEERQCPECCEPKFACECIPEMVDPDRKLAPKRPSNAPEIATPVRSTPSVRASKLVTGERQAAYGHPYPNHKRIANLWNARLDEILKRPLEPHEVAACMRLVKEARLMETRGHTDSLDDIAGYADVEYLIHEWEAREREEDRSVGD